MNLLVKNSFIIKLFNSANLKISSYLKITIETSYRAPEDDIKNVEGRILTKSLAGPIYK